MKSTIKHLRIGIRILLLPAVAVVAVAILLAWDRPAHESAEAAGSGPEIALAVTSGGTACPGGFDLADACVMAGNPFTLTSHIVSAPAVGYVGVQTFIDYATYNPSASEDGGGPNSCSDASDNGDGDGADRRDSDCVTIDLIYTSGAAADEMVWPDVSSSLIVTSELAPGMVNHGGLTGLIPPQPISTFIGSIVELAFTCSASFTSTQVQLLPIGAPIAASGGTGFSDADGSVVTAKVRNLTIHCLGPTPTPTITPIPPTPTPTVSPTPTNTPTPLPPPSERPDVKVTKVDLADPVDAATAITYRITVESIGLQTAEGVRVVDAMPSGTSFVSAVSAGANCGHNATHVLCRVKSPMAPTDVVTIDITVIAPSPADDTRISNTVTVSSTNEPFANTGNNKDIEETVILAPRSDMTLTKSSDPTFVDGNEDITYTLVAKNLGPDTAVNVIVTDTLPANATFVSSSNPECGNPVAGVVTCSLGDIAADGEKIVSIVVTSPKVTQNTMLKNTAFISADNELFVQTGNNLAEVNTPVIAPPPDLVVSKTDSADPVLRLGFYSYSITILNQGLGDALDVVVVDTLPTSSVFTIEKFDRPATFISATGAVCAPIPNDKVECTIDEILAGQQAKITLDVRAPTLLDDQTITNNVTASASDPDENPAGNTASETTDVKACFDVSGDGLVDLFFDILGVIGAAGSKVGDPGFDVIYDFDGDGSVDLFTDILPVIANYDQDCTLLI